MHVRRMECAVVVEVGPVATIVTMFTEECGTRDRDGVSKRVVSMTFYCPHSIQDR